MVESLDCGAADEAGADERRDERQSLELSVHGTQYAARGLGPA
jgi:hypothetical protein